MDIIQHKKIRLSQIVCDKILNQIYIGNYEIGSELPTERALANEFGISRTVVREAIQEMLEKKYIKIVNGKKIINPIELNNKFEYFAEYSDEKYKLLSDLLDVRDLLECCVVKEAATKATKEDIELMQKSIDQMKINLNNGNIDYDTETAFHNVLINSVDNVILNRIFDEYKARMYEIGKYSLFVAHRSGLTIIAAEEHQAILDAVKEKDSDRAEKLMRNHLLYAKHNILLSYRLKKVE